MDNIFLFSLPRSGSTLVQRVLSCHEDISTVSEPWILLPVLGMSVPESCYSAYNSKVSTQAINDLISKLPEQRTTFNIHIRSFVNGLYKQLSDSNARYFLDKTPRYHYVVNEIYEVFPDAKYIYLWRNPLSIIASSIDTWGINGVWNVYRIKLDLYQGLISLVEAYKRHNDISIAIKYEDLVTNNNNWNVIFDYLDLKLDIKCLSDIEHTTVEGSMGDKSGVTNYNQISSDSIQKWKNVINNPLRKYWAKRYLRKIGADVFDVMGYDMNHMLEELSSAPLSYKYIASDIVRMTYGVLLHLFDIEILYAKLKRILKGMIVYGNS